MTTIDCGAWPSVTLGRMPALVRRVPAKAAARRCGGGAPRSGRPASAIGALAVALCLSALGVSGCLNGGSPPKRSASASGALEPGRSSSPGGPTGALVLTRGVGVGSVAADRRHLVWVVGPSEPTDANTTLRQGKFGGGKTVTLARGVRMGYGLASTTGWVVYPGGVPPSLKAVRHDGSRTRVLSRGALLAPPASRGERVAWAEQEGDRQRVIVHDMARDKRWLAADMPRCVRSKCYRIDAVTLADRGVVFDRGAIGPQASVVVRRGFSGARPARLVLRHVAQPQLVPSSAGALYYATGHGWRRWDFGEARPRGTPFRRARPAPLVAYEHGHWLLVRRHGCESVLVARLPSGRRRVLASPSGAGGMPTRQYSACHFFQALAWRGRRPLSAWTVIPAASVEAHSNRGLTGAVLATPLG